MRTSTYGRVARTYREDCTFACVQCTEMLDHGLALDRLHTSDPTRLAATAFETSPLTRLQESNGHRPVWSQCSRAADSSGTVALPGTPPTSGGAEVADRVAVSSVEGLGI